MQADLSLCRTHIPHCWKSHVVVHVFIIFQGKEMSSPHEFLFHYCADRIHAVRYMQRNGKHMYSCNQLPSDQYFQHIVAGDYF